MFVETEIVLGTGQMGYNGMLTDKALADCLCDAADVHGALVGQSMYSETAPRIGWLLMGWVCEVYSRPIARKKLTVRTWIQKSTRALSDRDFEVRDENGDIVARATSRWMGYDPERAMLARLTPEILDPYKAEPDTLALPDAAYPDANRFDLPAISSREFTPLRSMIDPYGHVHNTCYLDIALEGLPEERAKTPCTRFEVTYKKEIRPGETVRLDYCRSETRDYTVIKSLDGTRIHAIIAYTCPEE